VGGVDLVFSAECLSHIEYWHDLVSALAYRTCFLIVNLFLPENPIGFVKSAEKLEAEIRLHFEIVEWVVIKKSRFVILFTKSFPVKLKSK
jgi:hypothetical protein